MALLWGAGVCYMALDYVGTPERPEPSAGEDVLIPASEGPTITQEDIDKYKKAIKAL